MFTKIKDWFNDKSFCYRERDNLYVNINSFYKDKPAWICVSLIGFEFARIYETTIENRYYVKIELEDESTVDVAGNGLGFTLAQCNEIIKAI